MSQFIFFAGFNCILDDFLVVNFHAVLVKQKRHRFIFWLVVISLDVCCQVRSRNTVYHFVMLTCNHNVFFFFFFDGP